jgi:hypothetical protein
MRYSLLSFSLAQIDGRPHRRAVFVEGNEKADLLHGVAEDRSFAAFRQAVVGVNQRRERAHR